jgi:competence protein ComFC
MFSEIFRPVCSSCGEYSEDSSAFCNECVEKVRELNRFCVSCGHPLNVKALTCAYCSSKSYDKLYTDYLYSGPVKDLLRKIKFSYGVRGIFFLGQMIRQDKSLFAGYDVIVPVPSHYSRRLRRVVHPAEVFAKFIAELHGQKTEHLLSRARKTGYQWKLKKKQRIKNVRGAFVMKGSCEGQKVLIIDDIYTTGSTVNECARVLKKHGAKQVDVYAFACSGNY